MPDAKALTEAGWKTTVQKFKVKDNGLQKALATYEDLDAEKYEERLKCIGSIAQLAGNLKKVKEVAAIDDVMKYLASIVAAVEAAKNEISKAAAAAVKAAADAKKKAD